MAAIFEDLKKASASDVIMWRDPKVSGVVFAASLAGWYLLCTGSSNLLTTGTRLIDVGLLAGAVHHFGYLNAFSESRLLSLEDAISDGARQVIRKMFPVLTWENPALSLACLVICFVISIVASYMSYSHGALFFLIAMFSVPLAYEKNKGMIDEHLAKANEQIGKVVKGGKGTAKHADPVGDVQEIINKSRKAADTKVNDIRYRGSNAMKEVLHSMDE